MSIHQANNALFAFGNRAYQSGGLINNFLQQMGHMQMMGNNGKLINNLTNSANNGMQGLDKTAAVNQMVQNGLRDHAMEMSKYMAEFSKAEQTTRTDMLMQEKATAVALKAFEHAKNIANKVEQAFG